MRRLVQGVDNARFMLRITLPTKNPVPMLDDPKERSVNQ